MYLVEFSHLINAMNIVNHLNHKPAILSLYRTLLRGLQRIPQLELPHGSEVYLPELQQELEVAKLYPVKYLNLLREEISYNLRQEFHKELDQDFEDRYLKGIELADILEEHTSQGSINLVQYMIQFRSDEFKRFQSIAQSYVQGGVKDFDGKIPLEKKFAFPIKHYRDLTNDDRETRLKQELNNSVENKHKIVRRYLKYLQMHGKLALPHRLPYTTVESSEDIDISSKVFKSTSVKAMRQAYNSLLIDSIIVPEIEHQINEEKISDLQKQINEKGPYQVKIRQTFSGAVGIPFVKVPFPRLTRMRTVAMDVKKLVQASNLLSFWQADPDDNSMREKKTRDGGYDISWHKQYGTSGLIYPYSYYKDLHMQEALWEFQMYLLQHKEKPQDSLIKIQETFVDSWMADLDQVTKELKDEVKSFQNAYNTKYYKSLAKEREKFQEIMNSKYDLRVNRLNKLVEQVNEHSLCAHSELVNPSVEVSSNDKELIRNDNTIKKLRMGMSLNERKGLGKRLANVMQECQISPFKIGMKYEKKFRKCK